MMEHNILKNVKYLRLMARCCITCSLRFSSNISKFLNTFPDVGMDVYPVPKNSDL
ncbi:Uncharacterised protein [Chlamydia trachomatis]|nr:Uncharacterised protein [Chlamydia trachomatis]